MLTKIILIRHGQTTWNIEGRFQGQSDVELMPEGIEQAQKLADSFPLTTLDAVYCSDLKRTRCTAKIIADKFNLPLNTTAQLREMNFGKWEGMFFDDINKKWPNAINNFFADPLSITIPDGETFSQVQNRAIDAIDNIISNNSGNTIAIVAHGAINRTILSYAANIPFNHIWSVAQSNTAYNIFSYDDEYKKFYIHTINNTSHLLV
ncbi:alpha-ribazole phosphatase [Pectinatus brassicae]|uniref:Alpha-ribazole phosphatase n=1 Tax=Pectinatus brassicae TaxID=862415 RepID=A0A840UFR6_9FIRM|nr:alpha-ribazole phosphatase [Pectinatus brassicae]MBB5335020.1 alpha-ribazole phosphatase [Pectinatus brassicae]